MNSSNKIHSWAEIKSELLLDPFQVYTLLAAYILCARLGRKLMSQFQFFHVDY